jgi:ferrochelatase
VLLCNLGTPDAAHAAAVRRYLAEFLGDPRVVEIPRPVWWLPILHGIILRVRPAKSAKKYASIWTPEGSPLKVWTPSRPRCCAAGWAARACGAGAPRHALRQPVDRRQLDALKAEAPPRVLILPPTRSTAATTTASVFDAVYTWAAAGAQRARAALRQPLPRRPGLHRALAGRVATHWQDHGRPDKLVMSFHGVPERTLHLGDPYHCECHKTARLLAERLGLARTATAVTFQSRFGKAKWLEPYTEPTLVALGAAGTRRVDVVCPGFTSDCLETLEEIAMEAREAFLHAGGKEFHYIPCLNDSRPGSNRAGQRGRAAHGRLAHPDGARCGGAGGPAHGRAGAGRDPVGGHSFKKKRRCSPRRYCVSR